MILSLLVSPAGAHEMTPTYPELKWSHITNVLTAQVVLLNMRSDAEYYEITVLDEDMNNIEFATSERILNVPYLERKTIDVYIRKSDKDKATYLCSRSRLRPNQVQSTGIQSRICSKFRK